MGSHRGSRKDAAPKRDPKDYSDRIAAYEGRLRRGGETDRTVSFSDAVFAIAMTLLVLDLKVPALPADITAAQFDQILLNQREPLAGFILSFVLVGRLWLAHHRRFNAIKSYDGRLQVINLVGCSSWCSFPFPPRCCLKRIRRRPGRR